MTGIREVNYKEIDSDYLEEIIKSEYQQDFDIAEDLELENRVYVKYELRKSYVTMEEVEKLNRFVTNGHKYADFVLGIIMQDLVNSDILPEGEILIHII